MTTEIFEERYLDKSDAMVVVGADSYLDFLALQQNPNNGPVYARNEEVNDVYNVNQHVIIDYGLTPDNRALPVGVITNTWLDKKTTNSVGTSFNVVDGIAFTTVHEAFHRLNTAYDFPLRNELDEADDHTTTGLMAENTSFSKYGSHKTTKTWNEDEFKISATQTKYLNDNFSFRFSMERVNGSLTPTMVTKGVPKDNATPRKHPPVIMKSPRYL